jgi:mxaD protein
MAEGSVDIEVAAEPDAVWAVAGDFGGADAFFPGIDTFRLEGDDRIIGMFGLEIRERLVERDDEGRRLTYSVIDGVPVTAHQATVAVEPAGTGSKVTWSYDVEPAEMAPIFGDTYQKALEALAARFT